MKVYISLPITGIDLETVRKCSEEAKAFLRSTGHEPVSPLDLHNGNQECSYGEYMGKDIQTLIDECEAIYFADNWSLSDGCRLEFYCAKIYNKQMMFADGAVPGLHQIIPGRRLGKTTTEWLNDPEKWEHILRNVSFEEFKRSYIASPFERVQEVCDSSNKQ